MIILRRVLKLDTSAREVEVPIAIHIPVDKHDHWECEYEIGWPSGVKRRSAYGIDSVQALLIALQNIGVEIYTSDAHRSGKLIWHRPEGGYGFPLHSGLRDLHQGDDKAL